MTLVTVTELTNYMGSSTIGTAQAKSAEIILAGIQNELEMYINRSLEAKSHREMVLTDASGFARLFSAPIHAVTKVGFVSYSRVVNVPGSEFPVERLIESGELKTVDIVPNDFGHGIITAGGVNLGVPNTHFIVEYNGGGGDRLESYYPSIKLAILRVASREWQHLHDDTMTINNGVTGDDVDPNVIGKRGWTREELQQFDRIRRRAIA